MRARGRASNRFQRAPRGAGNPTAPPPRCSGRALLGIGCLFLLHSTGWAGWLTFFVLAYGLAQGSGGIVSSAKAADLFSGPRFGTLFGWIALASGPGEAVGAWGGGIIFDLAGSYLLALSLSALSLCVGGLAIWVVGRRCNPLI